jgi:hypothetical protein
MTDGAGRFAGRQAISFARERLATKSLPVHPATPDTGVSVRGDLAGTFDVLLCVEMMLADALAEPNTTFSRARWARRFTLRASRACWYAPCTMPSGQLSGPNFREETFMPLRPATLIVVAGIALVFGFAGAASRTCAMPDPAEHASVLMP